MTSFTIHDAPVRTEEERADGGKITDIMSLPETVVLSLNQGIDASSMGDMMDTSSEEGNSGAQATDDRMVLDRDQ